jgi:hypothetical protein
MSLQQVTLLQSSLDTLSFDVLEDAPHDWTEANDRDEAHLATQVACDLLQLPANCRLRDSVYRRA